MTTYKLLNENLVLRDDGVTITLPPQESEGFKYQQWLAEGNTPEPADPVPNPRIAEIKADLLALDMKRIRPLAEGGTEYLATLNAQVLVLRNELAALS